MNFEELGVKPEIVRALKEDGITEPTRIQRQAIPLVKQGKDVVGMSNTGSGKTVAFAVPTLEKIQPGKGIQLLIMTPTRELAVQIAREIAKFGKYTKQHIVTVYGGVGMQPQIDGMRKADILVATPGRLLDHLQRGNVNLKTVNMVVLDEADKMVDMGFIEDVDKIVSQTSKQKQVLLFGATISNEIEDIKQRHMKNPEVAKAEIRVKEDLLEQYYYDVKQHEKFSLLVHLLNKEDTERVMIFCSARRTVEMVTQNLRKHGIRAEMIHGKLNQNRRQAVMDGFNQGKPKVLVASAVAARGLDIKFVTHIFNYDLSQDPQEYIHRIGRTARAGEAGKAITLLGEKDHEAMGSIMRYYDVDVKLLPMEKFKRVGFDTGGRGRQGRPHHPGRSHSGVRRSFGRVGGGGRNLGGRGRGRSLSNRGGFSSGPRTEGRFGNDRPRSGGFSRNREPVSQDFQSDQPAVKDWRDSI